LLFAFNDDEQAGDRHGNGLDHFGLARHKGGDEGKSIAMFDVPRIPRRQRGQALQ
jgi:hypothetical protein